MLPSEAVVTSGPRLLPETVSGFVVVSQPGSALMSEAHVTSKDHADLHWSAIPPEAMLIVKHLLS